MSLRIIEAPPSCARDYAQRRLLAFRLAVTGELPADALDTHDREQLVGELWRHGWTDREIAEHTLMSTYTTARIRTRLGLDPRTTREAA